MVTPNQDSGISTFLKHLLFWKSADVKAGGKSDVKRYSKEQVSDALK